MAAQERTLAKNLTPDGDGGTFGSKIGIGYTGRLVVVPKITDQLACQLRRRYYGWVWNTSVVVAAAQDAAASARGPPNVNGDDNGSAPPPVIMYEKSPSYVRGPGYAEVVAGMFASDKRRHPPDHKLKVVVLLRNPVQRAYSEYKFLKLLNRHPFDDVVQNASLLLLKSNLIHSPTLEEYRRRTAPRRQGQYDSEVVGAVNDSAFSPLDDTVLFPVTNGRRMYARRSPRNILWNSMYSRQL